jgi:hypothetical protein
MLNASGIAALRSLEWFNYGPESWEMNLYMTAHADRFARGLVDLIGVLGAHDVHAVLSDHESDTYFVIREATPDDDVA